MQAITLNLPYAYLRSTTGLLDISQGVLWQHFLMDERSSVYMGKLVPLPL